MDNEFQVKLTYLAGIIVVLFLLPFAVYHGYLGNWPIAILICLIIATETVFILHMRRGGSSEWAAHVVSATYTLGSIFVVHTLGAPGTYWIYPAVISNYYILPRRSALAINVLAIIFGSAAIIDEPEFAVRLFATLSIITAFGYVFSRLVSKQRDELSRLSLIDPLTLVGNRRALDEQLPKAISLKARHGWRVSAIMLDVDHFKEVNDEHDHHTGDVVLKAIAELIKNRLRKTDSLYRYGGEEFVVVALHASQEDAEHIAEDIRWNIMRLAVGKVEGVTVSAGVAELQVNESPDEWIHKTDLALYAAKKSGRNRVCGYSLKLGIEAS
ncbi:MAG: GGDEF domain-containing protein [Sedimenticola sp.]